MVSDIFLSPEETARLAGYAVGQNGWIIRGLKKKGIHIYTVSRGEPLVRRIDVEGRGKVQTVQPKLDRVT